MPTQVQTRRGTTAQHTTFTGAAGELTVDTDKKTVVVHDGTTAGGAPTMREDGSNSALALGSASAPSLKFTGDTNTGVFSPGADRWAVATGGSQRVEVDASGRVLVGTSSYTGNGKLAIAGGTGTNIALLDLRYNSTRPTTADVGLVEIRFGSADQTSNNAYAKIEAVTDGASSSDTDLPGRLVFSTTADGASSPTERMRIRSTGHTSINGGLLLGGTGDPGSAVYIGGSVLSSGAGNSTLKYNSNSGLVTYDASSRLVKEDIVNCPYGIEQIKQLLPRKYFRTDDQREEIGFVADELANVMPEFVSNGPKSIITKDENDIEEVPLGVYYEKLTAVLTKALQEAIDKIETLEAKVAALEAA